MRKPSIKPAFRENTNGNYYSIFFSSDIQWKFTNKRQAERFAQSLNKYLTEKILLANNLLADAYIIYRRLYFTMPHVTSLRLQEQIRAVEEFISKSLRLSTYENNGCFWCFHSITGAMEYLSGIYTTLEDRAGQRKITSDIWEIKSRRAMVELVRDQVGNFEKKIAQGAQTAILRELEAAG